MMIKCSTEDRSTTFKSSSLIWKPPNPSPKPPLNLQRFPNAPLPTAFFSFYSPSHVNFETKAFNSSLNTSRHSTILDFLKISINEWFIDEYTYIYFTILLVLVKI